MTTQDKFLAAVEIIDSLPCNGTFQPSDDLMLKLNAFYKQATIGPCSIPKPSFWDMSARTKWYAWNELGNMPKEVAMEKYVEELTKVIETMSYNEKVSKFMSLIGPFYEFVSTEEVDSQSEKNASKEAEYYFSRTLIFQEPIQENKSVSHMLHQDSLPSQFSNQIKEVYNYDSRPRNNVAMATMTSECDHTSGSQTVSTVTGRNAINIFKTKHSFRTQPFSSQKDLLVLTVINLQNSLEDIVKKLDKLQSLAKAASMKSHKLEKELANPQGWSLNFAGTAFALLWPLAVHLYMGGL